MLPQHKPSPWLYTAGEIGFFLIAGASILAAILISLIYIPALPPGAIHWPALVILYWACYQPRWQPLLLIFIMGILCDLLSGASLIGITSFIGVLLATLLRSQNHLLLALPFWAVWLIVSGFLFLWRGIEAMAFGLALGIWPPATMWLGSVLLSAICFPLVAVLLAPLRRAEFRL
ncbi:MAG TPA: rod shape-determining protein MreD [Alphaproteobacteria bacterium]|nr:rod shape-determining protein MreD [Rhodospirillaceae bacterium]HRJ11669.1 rod shape-determining protein MreD [Alphaproteobacteria bacterium]